MGDPITIRVERTESLDDATRAGIIDVCIAATGEEDFRNLFTYVSSGGRHFVARAGDRVVGHAGVITRRLQVGDGPLLRTAYVDAVATHPDAQGRGIGSRVMRTLARHLPDYEIACLETEITEFYERLGWELWRGPLGGRGPDGVIPTPDQEGIMILRLDRTPPLDLDAWLTIEDVGVRIW